MATVFFQFQSTHSLRSATIGWLVKFSAQFVSIHALLAECDGMPNLLIRRFEWFQSTHSLRSATGLSNLLRWRASRFNPRTPCGVRRTLAGSAHTDSWFQSTHSLRSATGTSRQYSYVRSGFNPRTPCGVRRGPGAGPATSARFQSTHSLRSATSTHFPFPNRHRVSIHALLAECDTRNGSHHPWND